MNRGDFPWISGSSELKHLPKRVFAVSGGWTPHFCHDFSWWNPSASWSDPTCLLMKPHQTVLIFAGSAEANSADSPDLPDSAAMSPAEHCVPWAFDAVVRVLGAPETPMAFWGIPKRRPGFRGQARAWVFKQWKHVKVDIIHSNM